MSSPALQLKARVPRLADAALDKARLTVVPRRRVRAARMPFVTLVSLVLLGGVVGLLCFNTQMQQASFAATALERQADSLTAREQTLHDELQGLRDPQHLATLAVSHGMVAPASSCMLDLAKGTTTSACEAANGDNTPALLGAKPKKPPVLNPKPVVVTVLADPGTSGTLPGTHQHEGRHQARR